MPDIHNYSRVVEHLKTKETFGHTAGTVSVRKVWIADTHVRFFIGSDE